MSTTSTNQCLACQGTHLTPVGEFSVAGAGTSVTFHLTRTQSGWFSDKEASVAIDRARICLDCGFVMIHLKTHALKSLRRAESNHGLEEIPEKPY